MVPPRRGRKCRTRVMWCFHGGLLFLRVAVILLFLFNAAAAAGRGTATAMVPSGAAQRRACRRRCQPASRGQQLLGWGWMAGHLPAGTIPQAAEARGEAVVIAGHQKRSMMTKATTTGRPAASGRPKKRGIYQMEGRW